MAVSEVACMSMPMLHVTCTCACNGRVLSLVSTLFTLEPH